MACCLVQGDTEPAYVGAAVWRFFLPGENPFVQVSDSMVLTGDCKVRGCMALPYTLCGSKAA